MALQALEKLLKTVNSKENVLNMVGNQVCTLVKTTVFTLLSFLLCVCPVTSGPL